MEKEKRSRLLQIVVLLAFIIMAIACESTSNVPIDRIGKEGSDDGSFIEIYSDSINANLDMANN